MALPPLKNLAIPQYQKPDGALQLKASIPQSTKPVEERRAKGFLTLQGLQDSVRKAVPMYDAFAKQRDVFYGGIKKFLGLSPSKGETELQTYEKAGLDERELLKKSFELRTREKLGTPLSNDERGVIQLADRIAKAKAKEQQDFAMGFIAIGDIQVVKGSPVVQKFIEALKKAKPVRAQQEAIYTAERASRMAASQEIGKKTSGEAGFLKELGAFKGELSKVQYESLRNMPDLTKGLSTLEYNAIVQLQREAPEAAKFLTKGVVNPSNIDDILKIRDAGGKLTNINLSKAKDAREAASMLLKALPKELQTPNVIRTFDLWGKQSQMVAENLPVFQQADFDSLFNEIKNSPRLGEWDKITARKGLGKAIDGSVPTEGELSLLNRVFPQELTKTLLGKRELMKKLSEAGYQLANAPRSIMASFDVSAPFRQGAFLLPKQIATHPIRTFKTFVEMFKSLGSEKAFNELQQSIVERPNYELMKEGNLALTSVDNVLSMREERFMSNWAEKIPGVRASSRAYTGFLNKLRADVFDDLVKNARNLGINPAKDPKFLSDMAKFVNAGSGRGGLGPFERAANSLNTVFFSPRLMASRLKMLNPYMYVNPQTSPIVRKEALKSLFAFSGTVATILSLAKLSGVNVGTDPRSSDFLKMRVGNTRIDIGAGFQQYLRMGGQLMSGKYVSSTTGKVLTLGEGYKPLTKYDILLRQFEAKEAPLFSFATDLLKGQTFDGKPIDLKSEIAQRFIPIVIQDIYDIAKEDPSLLPLSVLALFGVGVQTYGGNSGSKGTPSLKTGGPKAPSLKGVGMPK